jgi:heme exporter protein C
MTTSTINLRRYRLVRNTVLTVLTLVVLGGFSFGGLFLDVPRINILEHTARNLYFHVPMWFTLMTATFISAYHAIRYLTTGDIVRDVRSLQAVRVGFVFGLLGLLTGILWSKFTWYEGSDVWWSSDPRQNMAAVELMIYGAYFVLRTSLDDPEKRARISAIYNIFAASTVPFLLYVLPRQFQSLHPGADGNPAFSDITHPSMRLVFYPAVAGFIGLFWVLYTQRVRVALIKYRLDPDADPEY